MWLCFLRLVFLTAELMVSCSILRLGINMRILQYKPTIQDTERNIMDIFEWNLLNVCLSKSSHYNVH